MNTLIDLMQQKLQDLTNRIELLKQQFDTFVPDLGEDENLSGLVASLQTDVTECKTQVSNMQSSVDSLNNSYSPLVENVAANNASIEIMHATVEKMEPKVNFNASEISSIKTELDHLSTTIQQLKQEVSDLAASNFAADIDNELFFIVKGSYIISNQLTDIIDGTY